MKRTIVTALACGCLAACAWSNPLDDGLNSVRKDVRAELDWLVGLNTHVFETFLDKYCPATMMLIRRLGEKVNQAPDGEKDAIRKELAGLVEDRVYLYRDYERYRDAKDTARQKTCLRIFVLEDEIIVAETKLAEVQRKGAGAKVVQAAKDAVKVLEDKVETQYDSLDVDQ